MVGPQIRCFAYSISNTPWCHICIFMSVLIQYNTCMSRPVDFYGHSSKLGSLENQSVSRENKSIDVSWFNKIQGG